ncbi:MAG TPA: cobalamin-binding protein [Gammaproteobacteria bacterium]|nr:cobalamin-binding protein [Gammaproteobacteria bacterium]
MRALLLVLAWLVSGAVLAAPVSAVDDTGTVIHLPHPARRIVSLAPHATELLFDAGAGAQVVGTVSYSDYPPAARRLPRVGNATRIDRERVLALHPDLVVGWGSGNPPAQLAALRHLGIPVFVSEPRHFRTIAHDLRALGRLAGTEPAARHAAQAFEHRLQTLRRRYAGRPPVSVFFQVSTHPLITVTGRHIISRVLNLCGGRNIFANLSGLAPQVSLEAVLAARPHAIVFSSYPGQDSHTMQAFWARWQAVPAVRNGAIFGIPADLIARPTPRILDGAAQICRDLAKVRNR